MMLTDFIDYKPIVVHNCSHCGFNEPISVQIYRRIKLSKGLYAKVSPEDFENLSKFRWYASLESRGTKWYAIRREKGVKIRMHREIMGLKPDPKKLGAVVDHLDHDSLNNQRWNLELVTQEENMKRSKGWKKKGEKYA